MPKPIAVDPPGCGCTECLTGEYIPLDQATEEQVRALAKGKLANHTDTGRLVKRIVIEDAWTGRIYAEWTKDVQS